MGSIEEAKGRLEKLLAKGTVPSVSGVIDAQTEADLRALLNAYEFQKTQADKFFSDAFDQWHSVVWLTERRDAWRALAKARRVQVRELKVYAEWYEGQCEGSTTRELGALQAELAETKAKLERANRHKDTQLMVIRARREQLHKYDRGLTNRDARIRDLERELADLQGKK